MSDPSNALEAGWTRYFVKSSALLQRDLSVFRDESREDSLFTVVGKKRFGHIRDADGSVVMTAEMKGLTATKIRYTNSDGTAAADLKINSPLSKKYMELSLASGGEWIVVRDGGVKQFYSVMEDDEALARMDLTSLALKRTYPVEIADTVDLPLALGLVWAINFAHLQRVSARGAVAAV